MASEKADVQLPKKAEDLGYLSLPPTFDDGLPKAETFKEKLWRKTKQNPFVPIGLGVTTFALTYGLWQMKTGNKKLSQQMMRLRVGAQAFTIVALLGGVVYEMKTKKAQKQIQQQGK